MVNPLLQAISSFANAVLNTILVKMSASEKIIRCLLSPMASLNLRKEKVIKPSLVSMQLK